jgi:hypothetical protein
MIQLLLDLGLDLALEVLFTTPRQETRRSVLGLHDR